MLYGDIQHMSEDQRIQLIGHRVLDHKEIVGFIVEDDAKADRYMKKLRQKFGARIVEIARFQGHPTPGVVTIQVREASQGNA